MITNCLWLQCDIVFVERHVHEAKNDLHKPVVVRSQKSGARTHCKEEQTSIHYHPTLYRLRSAFYRHAKHLLKALNMHNVTCSEYPMWEICRTNTGFSVTTSTVKPKGFIRSLEPTHLQPQRHSVPALANGHAEKAKHTWPHVINACTSHMTFNWHVTLAWHYMCAQDICMRGIANTSQESQITHAWTWHMHGHGTCICSADSRKELLHEAREVGAHLLPQVLTKRLQGIEYLCGAKLFVGASLKGGNGCIYKIKEHWK